MKTHRAAIIITSIVCVIFILISLELAGSSSAIPNENMQSFLTSLFMGIFSSSFVALLISAINYKVFKTDIAQSYILPMLQLENEIDHLNLYLASIAPNSELATITENDLAYLEKCYSSITQLITTLVQKERLSWITYKQYERVKKILTNKQLSCTEHPYKEVAIDTLSCCHCVLMQLRNLLLYRDSKTIKESEEVLLENANRVSDLTSPNGKFALASAAFKIQLYKIMRIQPSTETKQPISVPSFHDK